MTTATISTTPTLTPIRSLGARRSDRAPRRTRPVAPLVVEARAAIALQRKGQATVIDLRDWEMLDRTGWVQGSLHCPPGEFATLIDPASPLHTRLFEPGVSFVFYGGPKAAPLAAARKARALGLSAVALRGGLNAWRNAGGKVAGHPESAFPVLKTSFGIAWRYTVNGVKRRIVRLKRRFGQSANAVR